MVVVAVQVVLHTPHCHSLKEKRGMVRPLIDRVLRKHQVRVAEVGAQDVWQRVALGFAVASASGNVAGKIADAVASEISRLDGRVLGVDRKVFNVGRDPMTPDAGDDDAWLAEFEAEMTEPFVQDGEEEES